MNHTRPRRQRAPRVRSLLPSHWLVVAAGVGLVFGGVRSPAVLSEGVVVTSAEERRPGPPRHEAPDDESPEKTADEEREENERSSDGDGKEFGCAFIAGTVERAAGRFFTSARRRLQSRAVHPSDLTIRGPPVAC